MESGSDGDSRELDRIAKIIRHVQEQDVQSFSVVHDVAPNPGSFSDENVPASAPEDSSAHRYENIATGMPLSVLALRDEYARHPTDDLSQIAAVLMRKNAPDLVAMWQSLQTNYLKKMRKRLGDGALDDDPRWWINNYLRAAKSASNLPPYHYMAAKQRRRLIKAIKSDAHALLKAFADNDLNVHFIYVDSADGEGLAMYEEMSEKNQWHAGVQTVVKVRISDLLNAAVDRAVRKISDEPLQMKSGINAAAIRFARTMSEHHQLWFGERLHAAIAIATSAVYPYATYTESDISKLLSR